MTNRERFKAVMQFEPVDRLPAIESYWWWDQTLERWYAEGLPRELTDHTEIARHLGLDTHRIFWITPRSQLEIPPGRCRDMGLFRNADEYSRLASPILQGPTFDEKEIQAIAAESQRDDVFLWLQIDGFFWFPRELLGVEQHLCAFYDQPDLIHRINEDLTEYTLRLADELCAVCVPDLMTFAEDMSYNNGPMISKPFFDEFLAPYYRRVVPAFKRHGVIPMVDSDGDATVLVDWLQEAGIEGLSPFERRAGNDIVDIRRRHPRFKMMGGFDKTVMHLGEAAMREEFERILPVMRSGGYIPSVDHQTPPDVSLDTYRRYVELLHEYCRKAASRS
jgi:hypothetical protein